MNDHDPARFGPIHPLPPFTFEMPADPSVTYGKAEMLVKIHPAMTVDLTCPLASAALEVTLQLREGASPAEIGLDLFRLYSVISELETRYGGAGLTADEARSHRQVRDGTIRVTFRPKQPGGAAERLHQLAHALNAPGNGVQAKTDSILRYEAVVIQAA